jgi:hypothetical protein
VGGMSECKRWGALALLLVAIILLFEPVALLLTRVYFGAWSPANVHHALMDLGASLLPGIVSAWAGILILRRNKFS